MLVAVTNEHAKSGTEQIIGHMTFSASDADCGCGFARYEELLATTLSCKNKRCGERTYLGRPDGRGRISLAETNGIYIFRRR